MRSAKPDPIRSRLDLPAWLLAGPLSTEELCEYPSLADLAPDCPICATYRCAGHRPRATCQHDYEVAVRHEANDHRYCLSDHPCDWVVNVRPAVLNAGLGHGTSDRPLALVLVTGSGRAVFAGRTYRDHQQAKPARTRAGGGGWQAKSRAFLVCSRCESLH